MQIRFTFETQYGAFSDALYLDEDHTFTDDEIEAMKQERLTNWIALIESPPTEETEAIRAIMDATDAATKAVEDALNAKGV
jgi:hypothetical protein